MKNAINTILLLILLIKIIRFQYLFHNAVPHRNKFLKTASDTCHHMHQTIKPNFMARFALACTISMYHQHVPSACISMYHQHYHQHYLPGIISDAIVLSPFSLCFWIAFHNLLLKHS